MMLRSAVLAYDRFRYEKHGASALLTRNGASQAGQRRNSFQSLFTWRNMGEFPRLKRARNDPIEVNQSHCLYFGLLNPIIEYNSI
jgi:hypothetical protein